MNRRLLVFAAAALLAGCATTPTRIAAPAVAGFDLLEPLYSAVAGREALTIRVASNGCTKKEDFAFFVENTPAGPRLAFGRKRIDPCKSFAMGAAELTFTWSELGLEPRTPVFILNPMAAWTGPGG
jgi:hypothetical protein